MKKTVPVRLLQNEFKNKVQELEDRGATPEELKELLGRGRAKKGIFEGDLVEGELEIGQVSATISGIKSVKEIFENLEKDYSQTKEGLF